MRIIHISDPHLSSLEHVRFSELRGKRLLGYQSWYRKRRHQYQSDTLHRVTDAIRSESADLVIVSGDLVHIGLESELREARTWLESLGSADKVLVTPGNHDCYHPESWRLVQRLYAPYLGTANGSDPASVYPVLRHADGVSIVLAASARPSPWWAACGTLGADQRERLQSMLYGEHEHLTVLVLHHPPLPGMAAARKALTDAHELRAILEDTRPDITLHGHLHRNLATATPHGRIFCTAPPSSTRRNAPASYRVFEITAAGDAWQIDMILKSLVHEQLTSVEELSWTAERSDRAGAGPSVDSGEGNEARTQ